MNEEKNEEGFEEIEITEGDQPAASAEESTGDEAVDAEASSSGETAEEPKKPSKFQKRIDDLVHKQREAERQRDEYYRVAQKIMDENNSLRQTAQQFSSTSVNEMEARIESDIEKAKSDYRKAYEDGDADKIIEAQDRMIKAASQNAKLDNMRSQAAPENYQPQEPIAPPPDTKALEWASRNQWFQKDMVMTNAAYAIHDDVVRSGVQASTEQYYDLIDQRMREEFPHKFQEEAQDTPSPARKGNVAQVVTPGGNESGRSKKVRLSPSQKAVANRLGVSLEDYAKHFVALNK